MKTTTLTPDLWADTPITITTNHLTGVLDGDDHGYRDVPDIDSNEEMVDAGLQLYVTPDYDGFDIYGGRKRVLPGGVCGGRLLLRRYLAVGLSHLDDQIRRLTGNAMQLQLVDGYRTPQRQAAGFTETMMELAAIDGLGLETLTPSQQVLYGRRADLTFSWVRVCQDDAYAAVLAELRADGDFMQQLRDGIGSGQIGGSLDDALSDYILHSVNNNFGRAAGRGIRLNGNRNAHSGGGAIDLMIRGKLGGRTVPLSHVPFDYASPISAMLYLEGDNYSAYVAAAKADQRLADHLKQLGFDTPDDFKRSDWTLLQQANRIRYYAFLCAGGSFYDPGDPTQAGENWHFQLGNKVYGLDGAVLLAEPSLSGEYPDAGNTCHTLLRVPAGPKRVAVRTGNSAYALVQATFGHTS